MKGKLEYRNASPGSLHSLYVVTVRLYGKNVVLSKEKGEMGKDKNGEGKREENEEKKETGGKERKRRQLKEIV